MVRQSRILGFDLNYLVLDQDGRKAIGYIALSLSIITLMFSVEALTTVDLLVGQRVVSIVDERKGQKLDLDAIPSSDPIQVRQGDYHMFSSDQIEDLVEDRFSHFNERGSGSL